MKNDESWLLRFGIAVLLSIWVTSSAPSMAFIAWIGLILATLPNDIEGAELIVHKLTNPLPLHIFRFGKYLGKREVYEVKEYLGPWKTARLHLFHNLRLPEARMLDRNGLSGEPKIFFCFLRNHYFFTYPQGYEESLEPLDQGRLRTRRVGVYGD